MKWQDLFEDRIIERGLGYIHNIEYLYKNGTNYYAIVSGTHDYDVTFTIENGIIKSMNCTCPYGNGCKHMVAVLLEIEYKYERIDGVDFEDELPKVEPTAPSLNYQDLMNSCDLETLRSFVLDVLHEDSKYVYKLREAMNHNEMEMDCTWLYRKVDSIMNRADVYDYFEDEECERDDSWMYDLGRMLSVDCMNYVNSEYKELGFKVSWYIFRQVMYINCDDSYLLNKCVNVWKECVADNTLNQTIFTTFMNFLTKYPGWKFNLHLEEILFSEPLLHLNQVELIKYINDKINALQGFKEAYMRDKYIMRYVIPLLMLCDSEKVEILCKEHWKYIEVKEWYAEYCVRNNQLEKAIEVLLECEQESARYFRDTVKYRTKLKEIHKQTGNQQEYLLSLYTLLQTGDIDIYNETKNQYDSDDWNSRKLKIIESINRPWVRCMYYNEEKMYEDILRECCEDSGLSLLEEYLDILAPLFPVTVLDKYTKEVNEAAERAQSRRDYNDLVKILKKMCAIEGGNEVVNTIKEDWFVRYKNKRAMMEILRGM